MHWIRRLLQQSGPTSQGKSLRDYMKLRDQIIPFDSICKFLKKTYDRPGRKEAALLDYLTLHQGKGSVRDLITTRTNKLSILTRLGAKPLNSDLDRALVLRALSAPLSEFITSRPHHLSINTKNVCRKQLSFRPYKGRLREKALAEHFQPPPIII